jgi:hypothetical protein
MLGAGCRRPIVPYRRAWADSEALLYHGTDQPRKEAPEMASILV